MKKLKEKRRPRSLLWQPVLARIPFKMWKISTFFSMPSFSSCLCSSIFSGPAPNEFVISRRHTRGSARCEFSLPIVTWQSSKPVYFLFCSFRSFHLFRWFRVVVSGLFESHSCFWTSLDAQLIKCKTKWKGNETHKTCYWIRAPQTRVFAFVSNLAFRKCLVQDIAF